MHVDPPPAVFSTIILFFFFRFLKKKKKNRKLHDYHHKIKSLWHRTPTQKRKHSRTHTYSHSRTCTKRTLTTFSDKKSTHIVTVQIRISKIMLWNKVWALLRLWVLYSVIIAYITSGWEQRALSQLTTKILFCLRPTLAAQLPVLLWIYRETGHFKVPSGWK